MAIAGRIDIKLGASTAEYTAGLEQSRNHTKNWIKDLKSEFGKTSQFGQILKIAVGGGAIAAVGMAAGKFKELTANLADLGHAASGLDMAEGLIKSLPVIGDVYEGFKNIGGAITGISAAIKQLDADTKHNDFISGVLAGRGKLEANFKQKHDESWHDLYTANLPEGTNKDQYKILNDRDKAIDKIKGDKSGDAIVAKLKEDNEKIRAEMQDRKREMGFGTEETPEDVAKVKAGMQSQIDANKAQIAKIYDEYDKAIEDEEQKSQFKIFQGLSKTPAPTGGALNLPDISLRDLVNRDSGKEHYLQMKAEREEVEKMLDSASTPLEKFTTDWERVMELWRDGAFKNGAEMVKALNKVSADYSKETENKFGRAPGVAAHEVRASFTVPSQQNDLLTTSKQSFQELVKANINLNALAQAAKAGGLMLIDSMF